MNILPKSEFSGIDFFDVADGGTSLDSLFPNATQFFSGVLECESLAL